MYGIYHVGGMYKLLFFHAWPYIVSLSLHVHNYIKIAQESPEKVPAGSTIEILFMTRPTQPDFV